jgi:hypothetical protein
MRARFLKLSNHVLIVIGKSQAKTVQGQRFDGRDFLTASDTAFYLSLQFLKGTGSGDGGVCFLRRLDTRLLFISQDDRRLVTEVFHGYLFETINRLLGILVKDFIFRKKPMQNIEAAASCMGHLTSFGGWDVVNVV